MVWVATPAASGAATGIWGGGSFTGSSSPKLKPKQKAWWEKGIEGTGAILGGLIDTGWHAVKDPIAEVATGGDYESKIDDIGKYIVDDYKKRYTSWDDFKSDPLAGVLDILTVGAAFFTMGGSLAVRGAATGATAGRAARVAGLVEDADLSTLRAMTAGAPAESAANQAFWRAIGAQEAQASATLGRKGMIDRALSGQSGRTIIKPDGTVMVPRRASLVGIDGRALETIPLANSPLRRLRQEAGVAISNRSPQKGLIGSEVRAGKQRKRVNRIVDESSVAATFGAGGARAVRKAAKKLDENEEAALFARNTIGTAEAGPSALGAMYSRNLDELEGALKLPAFKQRRIRDEAEIGARVVAAARKGGKLDKKAAIQAARVAADEARDAAKAATDPAQQEILMQRMATANKLVEKVEGDDFENFVSHRVNLAEAMRDSDLILPALRQRRNVLNSKEVDLLFRAPTKLMLRVERAQGSASKFTTDFIKGDLNKAVREEMADGSLLARMAVPDITPEELANVVVRPHSRATGKAVTARELRGKYEKKPTAPKTKPASIPEFSKYSRGYNFAYALDSMSPAAVFKVWNEARAFKHKTRILKDAARSGIRIDTEAERKMFAQHPDFEIVAGNSEMVKKAALLRDKMDNEVRLIAGDSIVREQASEVIEELLARHVDEAAQYAMPKVYHKHLTEEITRADNFVTRLVDTPTAVFRAAVLNLRPAWMVNNWVGQSMLLLYSQGVLHGAREYMSEVNRAVKAARGQRTEIGEILDSKAGALSMGAGTQARELAEAGIAASKAPGLGKLVRSPRDRVAESVEKGGTRASLAAHTVNVATSPFWGAKSLSDFMGHVNSVVTDDIPRRAAFMGEVRPILKRIQKGNPGMSTEDAMRIALADEDTVARLVDKTMGDLIDFSRMNTAEREVVRRLLPFWGWMKGITLRTGRLVRDDPHKAAFSYQLGAQYAADAEERLGTDTPGNLKGALRIGTAENGEPRLITLNGMNIMQTPADIAGIAANLLGKGEVKFGGTHPFAQLSPIVKAPIEVAIGRDLFFGGPLYSNPEAGLGNTGLIDKPWTPEDETRSKPAAVAARYLAALGPMALYQRHQRAGAFSDEEQRLLVRDASDTWMSYLAASPSTLNSEKAAAMANEQVQYGLVQYDPTKGETPGVFGGQRASTTTTPIY